MTSFISDCFSVDNSNTFYTRGISIAREHLDAYPSIQNACSSTEQHCLEAPGTTQISAWQQAMSQSTFAHEVQQQQRQAQRALTSAMDEALCGYTCNSRNGRRDLQDTSPRGSC